MGDVSHYAQSPLAFNLSPTRTPGGTYPLCHSRPLPNVSRPLPAPASWQPQPPSPPMRFSFSHFLLSALVSLAWLTPVVAAAASATRPNIVLLMGDDHGWDET